MQTTCAIGLLCNPNVIIAGNRRAPPHPASAKCALRRLRPANSAPSTITPIDGLIARSAVDISLVCATLASMMALGTPTSTVASRDFLSSILPGRCRFFFGQVLRGCL